MISRKDTKTVRWLKFGVAIALFLIVSIGLGYLFRMLLSNYHIPTDISPGYAMLIIFGILVVVNLSVLPIPFGVSIMLTASSYWNPVLIALVGSLGASLGEFSGYLFGYLGKRIAINDDTPGYQMVQRWIRRYGMWAIAFLSFQPVIPVEIGGFVAGAARMPVLQFLPALWIGKFPKYLILLFFGNAALHYPRITILVVSILLLLGFSTYFGWRHFHRKV